MANLNRGRNKTRPAGYIDPSASARTGDSSAIQGLWDQVTQIRQLIDTTILPTIPSQDRTAHLIKTLQKTVRALEATAEYAVDLGEQVRKQVDRKIQQFKISSIPTDAGAGDYILAYRIGYNGDAEDSGNTVKIARPQQLRRSPYDGATYNGVAYVYSDNITRTADGTEQTIDPPYVVGDIIYAAYEPLGGTLTQDEDTIPVHWLDINVDGRRWSGGASAGGFIIGRITSHTSGQTYVVSLFADGLASAATATGVSCIVNNVNASETLANNTVICVTQVTGGTYEGFTAGVLV